MPGSVHRFTESVNRSSSLFLRNSGRKTAVDFSWNCSRQKKSFAGLQQRSRKALFPSGQENRTGGPLLPDGDQYPPDIENAILANSKSRTTIATSQQIYGCNKTTSNAMAGKEHHPNGVTDALKRDLFWCLGWVRWDPHAVRRFRADPQPSEDPRRRAGKRPARPS